MATFALVVAAGLNAVLAVCWMSWRPKHHDALASMLGVTRRNRPPIRVWLAVRKRLGIRGSAGAGLYALSEILISVVLALMAAAISFSISVIAVFLAQSSGTVGVSLDGQPATQLSEIGAALLSHVVSVRLHEGFEFTDLRIATR